MRRAWRGWPEALLLSVCVKYRQNGAPRGKSKAYQAPSLMCPSKGDQDNPRLTWGAVSVTSLLKSFSHPQCRSAGTSFGNKDQHFRAEDPELKSFTKSL